MKKYSMVLGLMMLSTIIFAQGQGDPKKHTMKQADKMKTELSLDDVQYKSIKSINSEFEGKYFKLRKDSAITREEKHEQMKTLRLEKNEAIKKVLTQEQYAKWESSRSAHAQKHRAHMAKSHEDRALRMQKSLSLSEQQTAKIKTIDHEFGAKFHALRKDSTLAKADLHERAKQLKEEYRTKTKSVLTEEQLRKWEAQKTEWNKKRRKY